MFARLITDLNQFLRPFYININHNDIFEETLLKLAGIEKQPKECSFCPSSDDDDNDDENSNKIDFIVEGIEQSDADKFLAFLKEKSDATVSIKCLSQPESDAKIPEDMYGSYLFEVDAQFVQDKLFPLFKDQITNLSKNSPKKLEPYQIKCENDNDIKDYKFLEKISAQVKEIAANLSKVSKGEFNVISKHLIKMLDENMTHRSHDCGSFERLNQAFDLFKEVCSQNKTLSDNVSIQSLIKDVNSYQKAELLYKAAKELKNVLFQLFKSKPTNEKQSESEDDLELTQFIPPSP